MANFAEAQSRLLILKHGDFQEAVLYRLQKGWRLHFILDASLTSLPVKVFVNHPLDPKEGPNRDKYREVPWTNESPLRSDNYDSFAEVPIVLAGSFNYFFTVDGSNVKKHANGGGYFLVDPVLLVGKMDDRMSLNSICCQTVMPKLLGTFDQWPDRLRVSKESGYNMIHFTPVQELGNSDSAYCLRDQRRLDPRYNSKERNYSMEDVRGLVDIMKNDWNVLSLTDLVYNHTANESRWVLENPDCSYNMINSPHLKPAYLMDRILWHFSLEVGMGHWENRGIPAYVSAEGQLAAMQWLLKSEVMPRHRFWEFQQCNVEDVISHYKSTIMGGGRGDDKPTSDIHLIPDQKFRRLKCQIDISQAIKNYYSSQPPGTPRDEQLNNACEGLRQKLKDMNAQGSAIIMDHVNCAVDNFIANARWRFVDGNGPRLGKVGPNSPLMWNYFTLPKKTTSIEEEEKDMNNDQGAFCMAHNGWVMSDDPLRNFAEPGSNVYLRRELIPWGDSVKLRYGRRLEDSPFLWKYMRDYTVEAANIFHGVRLDNCHSTPVHVAEYMLDEARKARPDLYVIAELFTNSEYADNTFINRLGINSLIREGLNGFNPRELSRLVHRYAGDPVGSFVQLNSRYIMPSTAHALFMDQTHDNESVIQKHTAEDLLPYSATIAMTCSAFGSNRGYDEMVPHYIDVVNEKRLYKSWTVDENKPKGSFTRVDTGIIRAKKILNDIHTFLEKSKYQEAFVNMVTDDIISVTRHNPTSHQSLILFAHTSFFPNNRGGHKDHVHIPGVVEGVVFEGTLRKKGDLEFKRDESFINGIENYKLTFQENVEVSESRVMRVVNPKDDHNSLVEFHSLVPGSVIIVRVNLPMTIRPQILGIRKVLTGFGYQMKTLSSRRVSILKHPLQDIFEAMNLNDLHRVLFRSDQEEKDDGLGFGTYGLSNGQLKYCGLQGIVTLLDSIRPSNDLGHPLCQNVREGDWLMDYVVNRLVAYDRTKALGNWFREAFHPLKKLPRYLIPTYFDAIIYGVYTLAVEYCWQKMSSFAGNSSKFVRDLSLGSVQLCSYVKTAKLPKLSKNLSKPHPPKVRENNMEVEACLTLSAGLPHFSTGLFRNWGRDTFIAMRGLLLLTSRFEEARFIILGYAGTLRHGLIPNLLGEGLSARYNCRDAVWFWLQCIKDYCLLAPHGTDILKDSVMRLYPLDHSQVTTDKDQMLHEVMQEALQKHADGLKFRERNAGQQIDSEMVYEGFNNEIGVNWETGFVFGGNEFNCGTWMDKMGSSSKAGNKGVPATPRDGSAVEIVGLSASVVEWLDEVSAKGVYPHKGVQVKGSATYDWKSWFKLIQKNFEAHFWIDHGKVDPKYHQRDLINKVRIYKDSVGSTRKYTDYQLRCNFPIAMAVCPNLFTPDKAWEALLMLEKHLLGPLGVKTLDPSDYNYVGDYFNSDDSDDYKRAKGFNYHQGPEWVWPIGYFLRAKLMMAKRLSAKKNQGILEDTLAFVEKTLTAHNDHIQSSDWRSLPELTNSNGAHCPDSCMAQAWSVSCLLEVLYEMSIIRSSSIGSSSN